MLKNLFHIRPAANAFKEETTCGHRQTMQKVFWFLIASAIIVTFLVVFNETEEPVSNPIPPSAEEPLTKADPRPRGSRMLGMDISEGSISFDEAFAMAKNMGVDIVELPMAWDEYEPKPLGYDSKWLPVAHEYYPSNGMKLALSLNPIDTNSVRLPADLLETSYNDPTVIDRFKLFVDFVASFGSDDVVIVSVGNEIDATLGSSEKKWNEYIEFFVAVAPYVREKFPNAVVGSKVTFSSHFTLEQKVRQLNESSDIALVTYYPFVGDTFIVKKPIEIHKDFKRLAELYAEKKIYFSEIGYPSGTLNRSSEAAQAAFIHEVFVAWDTYQTQIPFLSFVWLHDISPEQVANFESYYGVNDPAFASFLGTLGLRTHDGKDKRAFGELQKALKDRSW